MRGEWHHLGDADAGSVRLQPLARLNDPAERAWAAEWIAMILNREGVTIDPDVKELVWSALTSLASAPVEERTLTNSYHVATLDNDAERIFDESAEFIARVTAL